MIPQVDDLIFIIYVYNLDLIPRVDDFMLFQEFDFLVVVKPTKQNVGLDHLSIITQYGGCLGN
jgi:hypothetical protein